jgi:hypothetical protein
MRAMSLRTFLTTICVVLAAACGSSSQTTTGPSQIRCGVQIQGDSVTFSPDGGTGSLRVTTSRECSWSAQTDASWVALTSPVTGQGDGSVNYRVAANSDPTSRAAGIVVEEQRLQISQTGRPCTFGLSSALETFGAVGGERTVQVTASSGQCRWTAVSDVPWISIASASEGSGNTAVTIRVDGLAGAQRAGNVTIGGIVLRVEQSSGPAPNPNPDPNCTYAVGTPPAISFDRNGGTRELPVTTSPGCNWGASASADWITIVSGQSGSGSGAVRISVAANGGSARSASLRIGSETIAISQASACAISVNPTSLSATSAAGTGIVQVSTDPGCGWSATSATTWITVTDGATGAGSGQVRFSIAANSGPAREGAIAIGGRVVAITQASGCTYSISPAVHDVGGAGATGSVSVTTAAGCAWNASGGAEWIALASRSGTGPGQVGFTVSANSSPPRIGTFTVAGYLVTVNQASPCAWVFVPPLHQFDANGGNGAILVIVTGSCNWNAVSDVGWITVTAGASGVGNGLVQFVVATNGGAARTGSLTIAGQRYEVKQAGR